MFKKFILLFLGLFHAACWSQKNDSALFQFYNVEQELKAIQKKTFYSRNQKDRIEGNKEMMRSWDRIIENPKILDYPFDSLKKDISVLRPKDKRFLLITWNLPLDDGSHAFFGYLLVNNQKRIRTGLFSHKIEESYEYFRLIDRSPTIKNPETYIGTTDKWFGMLYTQLVECDGYYTLIAWDGNDKITQRKFVDVLWFRSDGTPVFGKDVFKMEKKNPRRLMFEWSTEVTMSLRYNEKRNQIIYNHLVPRQRDGDMEKQFQFYGPDAQFDALELKNNRWVMIEDISINSDITPIKESKKPKRKKILPGYKSN